jgi:hypothetical protein
MRSTARFGEASVASSSSALESRALIAFACAISSRPASVGATVREPPLRCSSRVPTRRSSAATCWLIADWL